MRRIKKKRERHAEFISASHKSVAKWQVAYWQAAQRMVN